MSKLVFYTENVSFRPLCTATQDLQSLEWTVVWYRSGTTEHMSDAQFKQLRHRLIDEGCTEETKND